MKEIFKIEKILKKMEEKKEKLYISDDFCFSEEANFTGKFFNLCFSDLEKNLYYYKFSSYFSLDEEKNYVIYQNNDFLDSFGRPEYEDLNFIEKDKNPKIYKSYFSLNCVPRNFNNIYTHEIVGISNSVSLNSKITYKDKSIAKKFIERIAKGEFFHIYFSKDFKGFPSPDIVGADSSIVLDFPQSFYNNVFNIDSNYFSANFPNLKYNPKIIYYVYLSFIELFQNNFNNCKKIISIENIKNIYKEKNSDFFEVLNFICEKEKQNIDINKREILFENYFRNIYNTLLKIYEGGLIKMKDLPVTLSIPQFQSQDKMFSEDIIFREENNEKDLVREPSSFIRQMFNTFMIESIVRNNYKEFKPNEKQTMLFSDHFYSFYACFKKFGEEKIKDFSSYNEYALFKYLLTIAQAFETNWEMYKLKNDNIMSECYNFLFDLLYQYHKNTFGNDYSNLINFYTIILPLIVFDNRQRLNLSKNFLSSIFSSINSFSSLLFLFKKYSKEKISFSIVSNLNRETFYNKVLKEEEIVNSKFKKYLKNIKIKFIFDKNLYDLFEKNKLFFNPTEKTFLTFTKKMFFSLFYKMEIENKNVKNGRLNLFEDKELDENCAFFINSSSIFNNILFGLGYHSFDEDNDMNLNNFITKIDFLDNHTASALELLHVAGMGEIYHD